MSEPTTLDRWFLSDCEGRLEIWREAVLRDVTRDEHGEIDSYSLPAVYKDTDLIASWDLGTWDEGEDDADDARRRMWAEIVRAHNVGDEVERLRAELADRKRLSTSPTRDDVTGLETLCAAVHAAPEVGREVVKDVAWRTFGLIRAWREQGDEVERFRVALLAAEAERDEAHAEAEGIITGITYLQGPEECLERECEEYFDDTGAEHPGVGFCSHLQAKRLSVEEHLTVVTARDGALAELAEERLTSDALRKNRDQLNDELTAARAASEKSQSASKDRPPEQLDDLTIPVHDVLVALGVIAPDQEEENRD
ncbi:hypothetical protein [Actinomadura madurae]|uniref:hypothetical protein n=1 Tax=Actinomadura madurae TaxID=1993 RepID=UPI0020D2146D|nr:hypothetical protein [Actinomadura madurae]MCP9947332.1 hypothetical protein [Actinomadura madurae]MCP9964098.1 hypothetical protein [Actinomadura madurae]MCP9976569.1 hypothetical protein [Actinomadura madurae]MCQ0011933.1 hypothetical protein [Actinomadura madurae]MCQ0012765.1 hypothetical protein [Actinomadura madurae]